MVNNMGSVSVNMHHNTSVTLKNKLEWTPELHSIFMNVVINLGGIQKATPKQILNGMDVPGLTRLNVASHLQKVRGFMKSGGHKRTNRLARNHEQFLQQHQLDDPAAAALSNSGGHRGENLLQGGVLSFIFETEDAGGENDKSWYPYPAAQAGGDQENDFFAGLSPIWNHFIGNSTAGQESYPPPPFSAFAAANQEPAVLTQFVPPTPQPSPTPTQLDRDYDLADSSFASNPNRGAGNGAYDW